MRERSLHVMSGGSGGIVCSDNDLRAIVHGHQLRWSPQSQSALRHDRRQSSRASSLDTSHYAGVFSSSAESLSQSPVLAACRPVRQQSAHSACAPSPPVLHQTDTHRHVRTTHARTIHCLFYTHLHFGEREFPSPPFPSPFSPLPPSRPA